VKIIRNQATFVEILLPLDLAASKSAGNPHLRDLLLWKLEATNVLGGACGCYLPVHCGPGVIAFVETRKPLRDLGEASSHVWSAALGLIW
jgi:hypothetical protein